MSPLEPPPRRRLGPLVLLLTVFALVMSGASLLLSPKPEPRLRPGFAFAKVEGRDVVLVPYERHWVRGVYQLLGEDIFQVRLAAVDIGTGEVLWDTQLSDQPAWEVSVHATDNRYAYLTTDSGLVTVAMTDGSTTTKGGQAEGPAKPTRLPTEPPAPDPTATEAALGPTERITLQNPPGTPGKVLLRVTPNGTRTPVGHTMFHDAQLVVSGRTAVGTGHVLIQHRSSTDDNGTLSAVSLATGRTTASVPIRSHVEHAATNQNGTTAITTQETLAILHTDGRLTTLDLAAADFLPRGRHA